MVSKQSFIVIIFFEQKEYERLLKDLVFMHVTPMSLHQTPNKGVKLKEV